jgi:hypothetical protein
MNVDGYGDAIPVPAFGPRMVCTACGIVGAFARPNWQGARARAGRGEPDGGYSQRCACAGRQKRLPMTSRETTTLAFELAFATALAFGVGEILRMAGLPMYLVLPGGQFIWAGAVLYFVR